MIRSTYLKGKHALLPNLPYPEVEMKSGHAYASLTECISYFLASGHETETIDTNTSVGPVVHLSESKVAKDIYKKGLSFCGDSEEDLVVICVNEWSDDFDANNAKDNRFSVWIKTSTFLSPHGKTKSLNYTYPIAMGLKGQCHDGVEELYANELKQFQQHPLPLFYHGGRKKMVRVYVGLLASLQDQPERRGANYILRGNSKYTARWGHSMNLAVIADKLVACRDCLKELVEGTDPSTLTREVQCTKCTCWNTECGSNLLGFPVPKDYPESEMPASGKLQPKTLGYDMLKSAVAKAFEKIVSHEWTKTNALALMNGSPQMKSRPTPPSVVPCS